MEILKLYIGGKWIAGDSGSFIEVENPATKEIIARVPEGNETDVNRAVKAAKEGFKVWKNFTPSKRAQYLYKVADYLEEHKEEIGVTVTSELGIPKKLAVGWHVEAPIIETRFFAKIAEEFEYETKGNGHFVRREPIGVVAGLTPWNYPLDQVTVKLLPAIAAGNAVILKPSQMTPLSAYHLAKAMEYAKVPAGVFNLVTGRGGQVGNVLAAHPDIQMISFTGSTGAGRQVGQLALSNIKRIALELGGKSASVVLKGADYQKAVEATVTKCFLNSGQTCSAWTRMIVPREEKEKIEPLIIEQSKKFLVGDPMDGKSDIGPVINQGAFEKIKGYIEAGLEEGANMLIGEVPESCEKGYYIKPVVFIDVNNTMKIAREEIFGPVLCVIYYDTKEEALAIANDSPYGLSGAVFGESKEAKAFANEMETGVVHLNGAAFTVEAPFGGYKQSGIGRENSKYSFDEYLEIKAMLV
ncbi:MAG: aldehyde dehydrogenase family protein [Anaerostipes sp.]|nr:aldehyde dehydrogenase family protein [Anaerostipes sp.]